MGKELFSLFFLGLSDEIALRPKAGLNLTVFEGAGALAVHGKVLEVAYVSGAVCPRGGTVSVEHSVYEGSFINVAVFGNVFALAL